MTLRLLLTIILKMAPTPTKDIESFARSIFENKDTVAVLGRVASRSLAQTLAGDPAKEGEVRKIRFTSNTFLMSST